MSRELENPRKWRFTWEAQSQIPFLKLFLFNPHINPSIHCKNLNVELAIEQHLIRISYSGPESSTLLLSVPVPRVLVDAESGVQFRALEDHVEVKLALLLPVDHPILSSFDSEDDVSPGFSQEVFMDSAIKSLSSMGEVRFYCRGCSIQLTRPIRLFVEMPSVNWREAADNWFGNCCCSFGGISEQMVTRYAKSYTSAVGMCLVSTTSVVLCKDDLVGHLFPSSDRTQKHDSNKDYTDHNCSTKGLLDNDSEHGRVVCLDKEVGDTVHCNETVSCRDSQDSYVNLECDVSGKENNNIYEDFVEVAPGCCGDATSSHIIHKMGDCSLETYSYSFRDSSSNSSKVELLENQKSFLNGFLGDVFMAKSAYLSERIQWVNYCCPQCSCLLGAYPSNDGHATFDGGVRFFKCYISTCILENRSNDLFRNYTLERMFTSQLLENADHELSFRTVIRDLQTRRAMLQIVLLNPSSFHCYGHAHGIENTSEPVAKADLLPVMKVLFSDCSNSSESQARSIEEWVTKNQADEVYMLAHQIEELIKCLNSRLEMFPASCTLLEGFSLSSMRR